ncbi:AsmA family protein [Photobacterium kishitanii]|uniref:AsmA family protein n=1 Tax=Photobacterium kishitanii TaxID=318456 RepID=A0A2T3KH46_9GAMM|nr:AsmA family protein [Photobacterium kishitanii]PSU92646.1 AsmA family protein [Photobacterium kishitanii]PSU98218.1 AsmA family protein [Photobacterium kishitanii]PSV15717.1 AsmA family protein [Photobacterium kishitanii]
MKKILYILLGLILLVVIGIGALVTFVNPNQFKPLLTEQVKKMTGRDLVIKGDISWRFFPTLGLSVGETAFRNPVGFAQPNLVQFKQADLSVSVLPLLSQQLDIGDMRLEGAHVFVQTLKDGVTNLDGLTGKKAIVDKTATETPAQHHDNGAKKSHWKVSVAGIELVNASAEILNDQTKMTAQLNHINFTLDSFKPQTWTKATFDVQGKVNTLTFSAQGSTDINLAANYNNVKLKAFTAKMTMKDGDTEIKNAQLGLDQFTLGQWSNVTFAVNGQVPDLSFDTHGTAKVKLATDHNVVTVQGLKITNDLAGKALPRSNMNIVVNTDASYDISQKLALVSSININADGTKVSGSGSYLAATIPDIRFALSSDNIDLDSWLPKKKASTDSTNTTVTPTTNTSAAKAESDISAQEPDLSALKNINVAGVIAIKQLKVANAEVSNVKIVTSIKQGIATINRFEASLYDGKITGSASVNVNSALPSYRLKNTISNVAMLPLLKAVANNQQLAGKANITADLNGRGLSEANIRHNIAGSIKVNISDGAVYGVNIADMLRNAKAKLKGQADSGTDTAKKTDFSALTTTLMLGKGIASTNNFQLASPLLAINGQGQTNLIDEGIDLTINTKIVASGKGLDEIKGISVPIHVSGYWQQPKYRLNIKDLFKNNAALESKAKKEINRGLEKLFGDKAKDDNIKNAADKLLKGLFN